MVWISWIEINLQSLQPSDQAICSRGVGLYFDSSQERPWRHWARPRIHAARLILYASILVFLFEGARKRTSCACGDSSLPPEYALTSRSFSGRDKVLQFQLQFHNIMYEFIWSYPFYQEFISANLNSSSWHKVFHTSPLFILTNITILSGVTSTTGTCILCAGSIQSLYALSSVLA